MQGGSVMYSSLTVRAAPSSQARRTAAVSPWLELDLWDELGELVALICIAVVSCSVCSLVSISKAAAPNRISPQLSPSLALPLAMCAGGLRLNTQHAVKKAKAMSRSSGPMMINGLPVGMKVPKAKAPTRVMLMPASMRQSPQAQHRAGEGML